MSDDAMGIMMRGQSTRVPAGKAETEERVDTSSKCLFTVQCCPLFVQLGGEGERA